MVPYCYALTMLQLFIRVCLCASIPQVLLTSCGFFCSIKCTAILVFEIVNYIVSWDPV